ncbi:MAG: hypothetical protein JJD92_11355 [Frankiaceae bacterium]|nr:hypothetical protein [Frankiaceae bacterium]
MSVAPTFVEKIVLVHRRLADADVPHAFGGAIALGFHIESPRATADIDVNIAMSTDRARTALAGLPPEVGWGDADITAVERDGQVRLFWDRTPVDLFFPQHVLHDVVAARVLTVAFGGTWIPIISATDLTIFKALFARPRDWVDIEAMLEYGEVDRREVQRWLVRLLGDDDARIARWSSLSSGPSPGH